MQKPKEPKAVPVCSICFGPLYPPGALWTGGNNAQPINDGYCCDECNRQVVFPARLRRIGMAFAIALSLLIPATRAHACVEYGQFGETYPCNDYEGEYRYQQWSADQFALSDMQRAAGQNQQQFWQKLDEHIRQQIEIELYRRAKRERGER